MHVRLKKNRSGSISLVVVDKSSGRYKVNKKGDSMKNGVFTLAVGYKFRLVK